MLLVQLVGVEKRNLGIGSDQAGRAGSIAPGPHLTCRQVLAPLAPCSVRKRGERGTDYQGGQW